MVTEQEQPLTGFIGLGAMGEPMALNLAKARTPLVAWNRSIAKTGTLADAGAAIAADAAEVFERCEVVLMMLSDGEAIDSVLGRGTSAFAGRVAGHTLVNMATVSPAYSKRLESEIAAAGGAYVEAPVSGSREPAIAGQLVAMLAGDPQAVERVEPLLTAMCKSTVRCGAVPGALGMKFAVNIFLIASITGLAEAANFARAQQLDMDTFYTIINASQMASDISRTKVAKLQSRDFSAQAAIANVLETNRLVAQAAREIGAVTPLIDACEALYVATAAMGLGGKDMIAVVDAFERETGMAGSAKT